MVRGFEESVVCVRVVLWCGRSRLGWKHFFNREDSLNTEEEGRNGKEEKMITGHRHIHRDE